MADQLPKFIVIQSVFSKHYAYFMTESEHVRGYIRCGEEHVTSVMAKIEVEKSKFHSNYVHLRFYHSNRYWARLKTDIWMFASSNEPVEDRSSPSCTLFEPIIGKDGNLYFTHVQSGGRVRASFENKQEEKSYRLFIDETPEFSDKTYAFSFVDWDTLVQLPENVAFKGDNNKHLGVYTIEGYPYLQFASDDSNEERNAQVVKMAPHGQVQIFSKSVGKYWRLSPNWIWADSADGSGEDSLFWPVRVDETTIALRSEGNKMFCRRLTIEGKTNCLNAAASTIVKEARLNVVELVSESKIFDVVYRMEDARIHNETPIIAGSGTAVNNSNSENKLTVNVEYTEVESSSFKNSYALKVGGKMTFEGGIPFILEAKIEVSAEATTTIEWNTTTTKSKKGAVTYQANVPPRSMVRVDYMATKGTCDVPFNYTRRDKSSTTGAFITTKNIDGVYRGVNFYHFFFNQPKIDPI